jgi:hypothetical protein
MSEDYNIKITQCVPGISWVDIITIEVTALPGDVHTGAIGALTKLTEMIARSNPFHIITPNGEGVVITPAVGPIRLKLVKFK